MSRPVVTTVMVEAAAAAISDFFEGGYRSHWCSEWTTDGRCELCTDVAVKALAAALAAQHFSSTPDNKSAPD